MTVGVRPVVIIPLGWFLALLLCALTGFLIRLLQLLCVERCVHLVCWIFWTNGVVGRDVHALLWVLFGVVELVIRLRIAGVEEPGRNVGVAFADGFAVPASAFRVGFIVGSLVSLACPSESVIECSLGDFVVVVNELFCGGDSVVHVCVRRKLMGVPCEVDIEGRHGHMVFVPHDGDKARVFGEEAFHCTRQGR